MQWLYSEKWGEKCLCSLWLYFWERILNASDILSREIRGIKACEKYNEEKAIVSAEGWESYKNENTEGRRREEAVSYSSKASESVMKKTRPEEEKLKPEES